MMKKTSLEIQIALIPFIKGKLYTWNNEELDKEFLPLVFTKEKVNIFFEKNPELAEYAPYDLISDELKIKLCFRDFGKSREFFTKCCRLSPYLFDTKEKVDSLPFTSDYMYTFIPEDIKALILDKLIRKGEVQALENIHIISPLIPYFLDNETFFSRIKAAFFQGMKGRNCEYDVSQVIRHPMIAYYFLLYNHCDNPVMNFYTTLRQDRSKS
jgi:hypothetical protein